MSVASSSKDNTSLSGTSDQQQKQHFSSFSRSAPSKTVKQQEIDSASDASGNSGESSDRRDLDILAQVLSTRSEEYRLLFRLPSDEKIICFTEITSVRKAKTAAIFPTSIEIVTGEKKYFFGSFLSCDEAYRRIVDGWAQHNVEVRAYIECQDNNGQDAIILDKGNARKQQPKGSNAADSGDCCHESASALMHLRARNLREISGDCCRDITDATLVILAARHELLESLQIGPDPCEKITSDAIRGVAICCPRLKRIRLSGIWEINGDSIEALARNCNQLEEIAFLDCGGIDFAELGNVTSLQLLSVAGTRNIDWLAASISWSKLPNLTGLDVSRTDVSSAAVSRFFTSKSLKVLCALNCPSVEEESHNHQLTSSNSNDKILLAIFTDVVKGIDLLFHDCNVTALLANENKTVLEKWSKRKRIADTKKGDDVLNWLQWILSQSLLRIAETNPSGMEEFWLHQGAFLLLCLLKSSQEDVQERAATGLATFVVVDDKIATVNPARAEAVLKDGGVPLLLELAKSCREGIQAEATKAIANLSVNPKVAKTVADGGGINILADLTRSMNKLVAEEAAGGLWNLSVGEENKNAIAEAGGVKGLVDLIFKWPSGIEGILERAAGALANLAADDKCSMEVAMAGGVHALVTLARSCKVEGVQEQTARALANLTAHGDSNSNNATVGQEAGALEALVQLTYSLSEGVRQEAAGALWNLSFDDRNREAIAAAGGVEALVALAKACSNASQGLQERAAGALWGLSVSEANSVAIGQEGGVAPLIALARSDIEDVHETAAGALWNLAFNAGNALRIVEEGGVAALSHLCSSSASRLARFMAALALAYMFDGRMDDVASLGTSKSVSIDGARRTALMNIESFIHTFSDPQIFSVIAASSAPANLAQAAEIAYIQEAGHLRCSGSEIGRFVTMLRNPSPILRSCAAFALVQFTIPGGRHVIHHVSLLQNSGAGSVLRAAAAGTTAPLPLEAKIFARMVLRNLEHQQRESLV